MNLMTKIDDAQNESHWQAIVDRDGSRDGQFVYAVKTTGVFCRPSCPSRRAKRENIAFFDDQVAAAKAGFRACKRCKPELGETYQARQNARYARMIEAACRYIENAEDMPSLDEIAAAVDCSPSHFHRLFKASTGLTPRDYAAAHRARRLRLALEIGKSSVTQAFYDAGYNSSSRFYEAADAILGMKPKTYRTGGMREEIRFAIGQSSLGAVLVAASRIGVCAILLGEDPQELIADLEQRFPKAELLGGDRAFEDMVAQVIGFVEEPRLGLNLPLDMRGTAFQQRVWQALCAIPAGETVSYGEIAERIGAPKSMRAVAGACAANKIAVAVPCHRVVRQDGDISGYRWGVERKKTLLAREQQP